MRSDKRETRMRQIEDAAYQLFASHGFEGTSMLAIAKQAKASNETLYRWYGDKKGLFESMVQGNAAVVQKELAAALAEDLPPLDALSRIAPVLLEMLLSDRAILLNRAAASDPTGTLGAVLAKAGREEVFPLVTQVLDHAVASGALAAPQDGPIGLLFLHLLVGDQQIRRVIGTLDAPNTQSVAEQAARAINQLRRLCPSSP